MMVLSTYFIKLVNVTFNKEANGGEGVKKTKKKQGILKNMVPVSTNVQDIMFMFTARKDSFNGGDALSHYNEINTDLHTAHSWISDGLRAEHEMQNFAKDAILKH